MNYRRQMTKTSQPEVQLSAPKGTFITFKKETSFFKTCVNFHCKRDYVIELRHKGYARASSSCNRNKKFPSFKVKNMFSVKDSVLQNLRWHVVYNSHVLAVMPVT